MDVGEGKAGVVDGDVQARPLDPVYLIEGGVSAPRPLKMALSVDEEAGTRALVALQAVTVGSALQEAVDLRVVAVVKAPGADVDAGVLELVGDDGEGRAQVEPVGAVVGLDPDGGIEGLGNPGHPGDAAGGPPVSDKYVQTLQWGDPSRLGQGEGPGYPG
ncbi:hypothetical protein ES703_115205 [subsurface metagenome]